MKFEHIDKPTGTAVGNARLMKRLRAVTLLLAASVALAACATTVPQTTQLAAGGGPAVGSGADS